MLVSTVKIRNITQKQIILMKPVLARRSSEMTYEIDKKILCTAAHMLQEHECTNIQLDESVFVKIKNIGQ
jgi:hypothetical protein